MKTRIQSQPAQHSWRRWAVAPLEPVLHASAWGLRLLGWTLFLGNLLFGWIWSNWLPQVYESFWLRGLLAALGLVLTLNLLAQNLSSRLIQLVASVILWLALPLFFSWMYLRNGGGDVWPASLGAMILVYYHLTDWRIATVGTASGGLLAWLLLQALVPGESRFGPAAVATDTVIIAFCWCIALLIGLSTARLRRENLDRTLTTIGIMAHELRTPLSTVALMGDAIQMEAQREPGHPRAEQLVKLGQRLQVLVGHMDEQINIQITNAKLLQLPRHTERISARDLVQDVVAHYPYAAQAKRDCVRVIIHDDFEFLSSRPQFSHVLSNLIKNALHALVAADSRYPPGALRIELSRSEALGFIVVVDQGTGILPAVLPQIFTPFYSNNPDTGHGLGLAFCQRVVQSAGGKIEAKSESSSGATFTITLPLA